MYQDVHTQWNQIEDIWTSDADNVKSMQFKRSRYHQIIWKLSAQILLRIVNISENVKQLSHA